MNSAERYTGRDGHYYLEQRRGAQSDHVQTLRASLFLDLANQSLAILDFGCGTGGVLTRLPAARRVGVEIGEAAAELARKQGIEVVATLGEVPEASVDVAISFHALEHVDAPLKILQGLVRALKPGGRLRVVVPGEMPLLRSQRSWVPNRDRHLYTWTPLLLGNLAERAGLADIVTRIAPMPTASRLVRGLRLLPPLSRLAHHLLSVRRNSLNVILDARREG